MTDERPRPYSMEEPPCSSGRILLSRAVAHYCALEWGLAESDIEAGYDGSLEHSGDHERVRGLTGLLGKMFADGELRTFARPFGGGEPIEIPRSKWELDAFDRRFSTSAIALERPFDPHAPETHWVFLVTEEFQNLVDLAFAEYVPRRAVPKPAVHAGEHAELPMAMPPSSRETLLRLPEVKRRTGLSRSTIYARGAAGTFPRGQQLGGNVTAWRESEVDAWIADLVG